MQIKKNKELLCFKLCLAHTSYLSTENIVQIRAHYHIFEWNSKRQHNVHHMQRCDEFTYTETTWPKTLEYS